MGYLRGTNKTQTLINRVKTPSMAAKVRRLEYLLQRNKPELQQFKSNTSVTATTIGLNVHTEDVTSLLVASGSFRDRILGDDWLNKRLVVKIAANSDEVTRMRIVVYSPKHSTTTFGPGGLLNFTELPDHTAFRVFADSMKTQKYAAEEMLYTVTADLRNLMTEYNSDGAFVDEGPIKVMVAYSTTTNTAQFRIATALYFTNK